MKFDRYERIADHYPTMWPLVVPGYVPILNAMQDIVRVSGQRPCDVLDLGCGPGTATIAVAPVIHQEGMVTLVDGSPRMLELAQRVLGSHVRDIICEDFSEPGFAANVCPPLTYDLIVSSFALHHLDEQAKRRAVDAMAGGLKPGGLLLLADETEVDRPGGWDVVERIRSRIIEEHLRAGRISKEFWALETSHPKEAILPFLPARVEDLTSWMARSGLAVSCPVSILGSALLVGIKLQERSEA